MKPSAFTPSECLSILAVLSDACNEVDLLSNVSHHNFPPQKPNSTNRCQQSNPDALLTELNKIFFQTLLQFEKAKCDDYVQLADGTFLKLNDAESTKRKHLEIVERIAVTLKKLYNEVETSGTFQVLEDYCDQEQEKLSRIEHFVKAAVEKEEQVGMLMSEVHRLELEIENEREAFDRTVEGLKHDFQELRELSQMTMKYKSKDYDACLQRDLEHQGNQSKALLGAAEQAKNRFSQVSRIGDNLGTWLLSNIAKAVIITEWPYLNKIYTDCQQSLKDVAESLESYKTMHKEMREDYERCDAIVTANDREKEALRVREEYAKKFVLSVVQIQSWWRTMMELGGYKRKRKKGKKKGKKKK